MRHIPSGLGKSLVLGLTAILALGPVSLNVLGRPTIGGRSATFATPTIPGSETSNRQAQAQGEVVATDDAGVIQSVGTDRSSDQGAVPLVNRKILDFTGNGRTDWTTLGGTTGLPLTWRVLGNPANPAPGAAFIRIFDYGIVGTDAIRPNDYKGDAKSEVTVRRTDTTSMLGSYYVAQFPTGSGGMMIDQVVQWGRTGDVSGAEGDYDGDGKVDYTVVRSVVTVLNWYILLSSTNTLRAVTFGATGGLTTVLLPGADYNNDGRDELVFARYNAAANPAPTTWFAGDAVTGVGVDTTTFGDFQTMNAMPPADYTGDGRADLMEVKLDGATLIWYLRNTATGAVTATSFGVGDPNFLTFDFPVRGDYDGDGRHDIAVWRPDTQTYYVLQSGALPNISIVAQQWGVLDDTPIAALGTF